MAESPSLSTELSTFTGRPQTVWKQNRPTVFHPHQLSNPLTCTQSNKYSYFCVL